MILVNQRPFEKVNDNDHYSKAVHNDFKFLSDCKSKWTTERKLKGKTEALQIWFSRFLKGGMQIPVGWEWF